MKILVNPIVLMGRGGSDIAAGMIFMVIYSIIAILILVSARRILGFAWRENKKVIGGVVKKYSIPEHWEWQAKAYVRIPEQQMLEIDIAGQYLHYAPVRWKYDRLNEGDSMDVLIKTDRFNKKIKICDIGPF